MPPKVIVLPGQHGSGAPPTAPSRPARADFVCQECGVQRPKWQGKCDDCGAWSSFVEENPFVSTEFVVTEVENSRQMKEPVLLSNHPGFGCTEISLSRPTTTVRPETLSFGFSTPC